MRIWWDLRKVRYHLTLLSEVDAASGACGLARIVDNNDKGSNNDAEIVPVPLWMFRLYVADADQKLAYEARCIRCMKKVALRVPLFKSAELPTIADGPTDDPLAWSCVSLIW